MNLELSKELVTSILNEVVQLYLIPRFKDLGMNASGQWIDSLSTDFENGVGYIKGQDYTKYLVEGRPSNENQDPIAIRNWAVYYGKTVIADWAKSKGIDIDPIAIAYKIARDGTNYYPNGTDLLEVLQSTEVIEYINKRLGVHFIEQIKLEFTRELKKL